MARRVARYGDAVAFIALNDAPADTDGLEPDLALSQVSMLITTALVADIFGRTTVEVARDVMVVRKREEYVDLRRAMASGHQMVPGVGDGEDL